MPISLSTNRPFLLVAFVALPLLVCMLTMGQYFPKEPAPSGINHIIAFEFVTDVPALKELLSIGDEAWLDRLDLGNRIDFIFMLCYTLLLGGWMIIAARTFQKRWLLIGLGLSLLALIGDLLENLELLALTDLYRLDATDQDFVSHLKRLSIFTWTKWLSLAVSFAMAAWAILSDRGALRWLGWPLFLPVLLSFGAFNLSPAGLTNFTLSIFGAFGVLIFYALLYKKPFNP